MGSARLVWHPEQYAGGAFYKPLFTLFLAFNYLFGETSFEMFLNGRWVFAGVGIAILLAQGWLAYLLLRNMKWALISVLLTASSYLFLSRGYRVRSDFLATLCFLLSAGFFIRFLRSGYRKKHPIFLAALFFILAFLSTPKAIFVGAGLLTYFVWLEKDQLAQFFNSIDKKSLYKSLAGLFAVPAALLLLMSFIYERNLLLFFYEPARYFIETFSGHVAGTPEYFSWKSFRFVRDALENNTVLFGLLYLGWLALLLPRFRKKWLGNDRLNGWMLLTLYLFLHFFLLPDKLPFYLTSLVPFFAIGISYFLFSVFQKTSFQRSVPLIASVVAIGIGLQSTRGVLRLLQSNNNFLQRNAWEELYDYFLTFESVKVFTGMGLFAKEGELLTYLGHGESKYISQKADKFKNHLPHFVLRTRKLDYLLPHVEKELDQFYVKLNPGIYVRANQVYRKFNKENALEVQDPKRRVVWDSEESKKGVYVRRNFQELKSDLERSFDSSALRSTKNVYLFKVDLEDRLTIRSIGRKSQGTASLFAGVLPLKDLDRPGEIGFYEDLEKTYLLVHRLPPGELRDYPSFQEVFAYDAKF